MNHISDLIEKYSLPEPEEENVRVKVGEYQLGEDKKLSMYSRVYHGLTHLLDLSPLGSLLVALIISMSINSKGKQNCCYLSQKSMASLLGVSVQTINENLTILEQHGLICRKGNHPKFKTIMWRPTEKTLEHLRYCQEKINENRR